MPDQPAQHEMRSTVEGGPEPAGTTVADDPATTTEIPVIPPAPADAPTVEVAAPTPPGHAAQHRR
ncbi:MAG: hypothetical protein ACRDRZ_10705, partial [Pseudonocardiaceae bacterium]